MYKKREINKLLQSKGSIENGPQEDEPAEPHEPSNLPLKSDDLSPMIHEIFNNTSDLKVKKYLNLTIYYIENQINSQDLNQNIIGKIKQADEITPETVYASIAINDVEDTDDLSYAILRMIKGSVALFIEGTPKIILASIPVKESRALSRPENESQVTGPQLGFNESLATNVSVIRRYLSTPDLCNEFFVFGTRTNTAVSLLYIKGIASEDLVDRVKHKLNKIKVDSLIDSAVLNQHLDDHSWSIFPQMLLTERPDRVSDGLLNGKIALFVDGSTNVILCPFTFIEFFESREDYNIRWPIATFIRLLRLIAMFLSIFFTAIYVAALTFHYEIIPQALLVPLGESRSRVPFPPLFEAVLLEFIIELLREAGARLPTKVGQTMGIVGGIVIGTAAVQAGFTSNILLIIVALSALASFTAPSYTMGNVIRIIRFPILFMAGFLGFYGVMFGFCLLLIHLIRLSSLGAPYLSPFYPPRFQDWVDSVIRLPMKYTNKRPTLTRPADIQKYDPDKVN